MKDRIKKLRKTLELTQQEFANRIGISRGNIATYETREGNPGNSVINLICREFNVSEKWLRTGEGEMFVEQSEADELAAAVERLVTGESAEFKRRLINALSTLKDEHWILLEQKLQEIVGMRDAVPAFSASHIPATGESEHDDLERQADEFAALAREHFLSEKRQELPVSSAKKSDSGKLA